MDYLLDIIKSISQYYGWIACIIIIIGFSIVISEKEEAEDWLLLKMIGFYILGGFNFNFNGIAPVPITLPIGYPFYLLTMKNTERKNNRIKDNIAKFGFIMLVIGFVNTLVYNGLEYRDRDIKTSNNNIYKLDEDWNLIKTKLNLYTITTLHELDIDYDKEGNIKKLYIHFTDENKYYTITKRYKEYSISIGKRNQDMFGFGYTNDYINIDDVINSISKIEFSKEQSQDYLYKIRYDLNMRSIGDNKNNKVYLVDLYNNFKVREAKTRELPVEGLVLQHIPMKKQSEGHWSSDTIEYYVIYPTLKNNLISYYNTDFITIENIKENKMIKLDKYNEKMDILFNTLSFETWIEKEDYKIDKSPYIVIKDSTGGVITIYENSNIVKYTNAEEEIYFEVSEMILKEVVDFKF